MFLISFLARIFFNIWVRHFFTVTAMKIKSSVALKRFSNSNIVELVCSRWIGRSSIPLHCMMTRACIKWTMFWRWEWCWWFLEQITNKISNLCGRTVKFVHDDNSCEHVSHRIGQEMTSKSVMYRSILPDNSYFNSNLKQLKLLTSACPWYITALR